MPRIVTTPPSTSIPAAFESTHESPAAPDNIDGIASSPASHSSSQATATTTMERSHEEAMETSVDSSAQQELASCQTAHCQFTDQKIRSLPLNEEILLYVRYMKNFVSYSDLSLEFSKVQSSAMDYCCRLWMDFSRLTRYSYTDTTTQWEKWAKKFQNKVCWYYYINFDNEVLNCCH